MKPVILFTSGYSKTKAGTDTHSLNCNYTDSIVNAGGIPLLSLSDTDITKYVELSDGLFLTGGLDVMCDLYGEEKLFNTVITEPKRDRLEFSLLDAFVKMKKPVLGVCRGIQVINVFFGGTLWQDIPAQLSDNHSNGIMHDISIEKESYLFDMFGHNTTVNSYHHQSVNALGYGLKASAYTVCKENFKHPLIEAVEHKALPIYGVQWHPERMPSSNFPIFDFFIKECCRL